MPNKNKNMPINSISNSGSPMSITRRLIYTLALILPIMSIIISVLAALPLYKQISLEEDQDLKRLANILNEEVAETKLEQKTDQDFAIVAQFDNVRSFDEVELSEADEPLIYAVWDTNGFLLDSSVNDTGSKATLPSALLYKPQTGFVSTGMRFKKDALRVYYYTHPKSGNTVAVAQTWRSRLAYMQQLVVNQLSILLLSLPFLIGALIWSVHRGLRPLNQLASSLHKRHAHDLAPINTPVPTELQPLIASLNLLFNRVTETINREQRFTADAAHELRTPITAIKLQANELAFSLANGNTNGEELSSLQRIQNVANRASHLIDQLLTLAKLDNHRQDLFQQTSFQNIDWLQVSEEALQSVSLSAREQGVRLQRHQLSATPKAVLPLMGDATLLTLLLRNLLDNAIKYGGQAEEEQELNSSLVELTLADDFISVRDHGNGINNDSLQRVKERFYRPAGQSQMGSGLGLSIVERITQIHNLTFSLENHPDGGVVATIRKS